MTPPQKKIQYVISAACFNACFNALCCHLIASVTASALSASSLLLLHCLSSCYVSAERMFIGFLLAIHPTHDPLHVSLRRGSCNCTIMHQITENPAAAQLPQQHWAFPITQLDQSTPAGVPAQRESGTHFPGACKYCDCCVHRFEKERMWM